MFTAAQALAEGWTARQALIGAGYRVLRYTWHDVTTEPERVVREIRAALAASPGAR